MGAAKHSKESLEWLEENYNKRIYNNIELAEMFSSMFRPITRRQITSLLHKLGISTNRPDAVGKNLKPNELEWLLNNHNKYARWADVAEAFSKTFRPMTADSASKICGRRGIKKDAPVTTPYTKEQREFLAEWITTHTRTEVLAEFQRRFPNRSISLSKLSNFAKFHKLKTPKELLYKERGILASSKATPIGTEAVIKEGGQLIPVVKVQNLAYGGSRNWKRKKIIVWEEFHQKTLPKGWCVVCLDGDEQHLNKENLYAVPRKQIGASLSGFKNHHPNLIRLCGADWTKAYLMTQELKVALRDRGIKL